MSMRTGCAPRMRLTSRLGDLALELDLDDDAIDYDALYGDEA